MMKKPLPPAFQPLSEADSKEVRQLLQMLQDWQRHMNRQIRESFVLPRKMIREEDTSLDGNSLRRWAKALAGGKVPR